MKIFIQNLSFSAFVTKTSLWKVANIPDLASRLGLYMGVFKFFKVSVTIIFIYKAIHPGSVNQYSICSKCVLGEEGFLVAKASRKFISKFLSSELVIYAFIQMLTNSDILNHFSLHVAILLLLGLAVKLSIM